MTRASAVVTWGMTWRRDRMGLSAIPIVLVACACLAASCGGSGSATGGGTTTSDRTSTTTNAKTSAVLAAYRASQASFEQALQNANPNLAALAQTMTGAQLASVRRALTSDQVNGIVGRGPVQLNPKVISLEANEAVVHDCLFSALELVYASTGKPVPPVTPPEHDAVTATLDQVSKGTWKVADQHVTEGSCPAGF